MNKHWYLITFISLFLANSHLSLAQNVAQELVLEEKEKETHEVCGKLLSSLLIIEINKAPVLDNLMLVEEEFCDAGQNEMNANYEISFFDAHKNKMYSKRVFLNPDVFLEKFDHKEEKFKDTQILRGNNSRVLKAPIAKSVSMYDSYTIKSLVDGKETNLQKIILMKGK